MNPAIIILALFGVALCAPQYDIQAPAQAYSAPGADVRSGAASSLHQVSAQPVVGILRDDRTFDGEGGFNFEFETEDGVKRSEAGQVNAAGAVIHIGEYSYTMPDGTLFTLKYVADENGFQPQSDFLPVAPAFPHELPPFVLAQIEKARLEDEAAAAQESRNIGTSYQAPAAPSQTYGRPL